MEDYIEQARLDAAHLPLDASCTSTLFSMRSPSRTRSARHTLPRPENAGWSWRSLTDVRDFNFSRTSI
jgi:hypothetical protein